MIFFFCIFCLIAGYLFIRNRHQYWARRNIPYLKPKNFLLGHFGDVLFSKVSFRDYFGKIADELAPHKYGGFFDFLRPNFIIRDPELIKKVLTKDFHHFINRDDHMVDENDILSMNLSNLTGDQWKAMRAKLTPTFTAARIKIMFNLMHECTQELIEVIDEAIEDDNYPEVKELMARFTTNVISSCIFGLKSDSLKNSDSTFRRMGRKTVAIDFRTYVVNLLSFLSPKLKKMLGVSPFANDVRQFFKKIVADNVRYREENNVHRNDLLDLLIALKHETKNQDNGFKLTDDLMVAQCFIFFLGGFETTAGALTFVLYELAKQKEIQERLFDEISSVLGQNNGEVDFECLQKMSYLGQVVDETLRLHAVAPFLMRTCTENYQIEEGIIIEKGTRVMIPTLSLQTDPRYFKNPLEFDPENFSKEAKAQRHHFVNLPFGEGPRMCIGTRFALMQVKLGLVTLLRHYELSLSPKMVGPLRLSKKSLFLLVAEGGIWIDFKKRRQPI